MCFVLFTLVYQYWIVVLFAVHYLISVAHIVFLQPLETGSNCKFLEVGLIAICAAVHLFAPYNMAEGRTRYRYIVAYCIEAIEIVVLVNMVTYCEQYSFPYSRFIAIGTYLSFLLGIFFMLIYYGRCHPNLLQHEENDAPDSCSSTRYETALSHLNEEGGSQTSGFSQCLSS
ncbi:unnamed protein product [Gongylonema pulchrum]|uniref:XK-related protein n=1 Tax=Gongylonema pulchrum TaxID=637853 RepID=A0A183CXU5_9BILA|nr:unnamed protein product [Gongylonema pulchrum]